MITAKFTRTARRPTSLCHQGLSLPISECDDSPCVLVHLGSGKHAPESFLIRARRNIDKTHQATLGPLLPLSDVRRESSSFGCDIALIKIKAVGLRW